jgi:hypothetical protein
LEYVLRSKEVFGSRGGRAFISMVPLPDDLSLNVGVQLKSLTGLLEWAQAEILARQEAK